MRADRLVATLLFLQSKGRITASQLAEELEVSVRTARRDLEALAMAGVPVYSQPGRGGGWSLIGGASTDLTGLTADEVRTLFLLAGPSSTVSPDAKRALRKLVQALPSTFRADAEAAAAAIVVDPSQWGRAVRPAPEHLEVLQSAVIEGVQVVLDYSDADGNESTRRVHPLGLVDKAGVWYLIAHTEHGRRTFRLSRLRGVTPTADPTERPQDFDLGTAWSEILDSLEQFRAGAQVTLIVPEFALGGLRGQFAGGLRVVGRREDGRFDVVVSGDSIEMLARQLAGWGRIPEVVEPPEVHALLAQIGRELLEHHDDLEHQDRSDGLSA